MYLCHMSFQTDYGIDDKKNIILLYTDYLDRNEYINCKLRISLLKKKFTMRSLLDIIIGFTKSREISVIFNQTF